MNIQEIIEKWLLVDRDTTPLWRLPIHEIEYDEPEDPSDIVEIASFAENIRQCGLIHPIIVEHQKKGKKYRLISGRRRIEAIRLLGRTHISALLVKSGSIQPLTIALSENIMRKSPHFIDLAEDLKKASQLIDLDALSKLLSVKQEWISERLRLTALSPYEKRLIRLIGLDESDALRLCKLENDTLRKLLLEKMLEAGGQIDRKALITQAIESRDPRILQSEKIYVRDIRIFLNSVERAAELMSASGFATEIKREDSQDHYQFIITVSKIKQFEPSTHSSAHPGAANVSRETSLCAIATPNQSQQNVSRETFKKPFHAIDERTET